MRVRVTTFVRADVPDETAAFTQLVHEEQWMTNMQWPCIRCDA